MSFKLNSESSGGPEDRPVLIPGAATEDKVYCRHNVSRHCEAKSGKRFENREKLLSELQWRMQGEGYLPQKPSLSLTRGENAENTVSYDVYTVRQSARLSQTHINGVNVC